MTRLATDWHAKPHEFIPNIATDINQLRIEEMLEKQAEYVRLGLSLRGDTRPVKNRGGRGVVGCGKFTGLRWPTMRQAAMATGWSVSAIYRHCTNGRGRNGQLFAFE